MYLTIWIDIIYKILKTSKTISLVDVDKDGFRYITAIYSLPNTHPDVLVGRREYSAQISADVYTVMTAMRMLYIIDF